MPNIGSSELPLVAGRLCLDFANTANRTPSGLEENAFERFSDLTHWGRQAGLISAAYADALNEAARQSPDTAAQGLLDALSLRDALWRLFPARPEPDCGALQQIQDRLAANSTVSLEIGHGRIRATSRDPADLTSWLLGPVAASAMELLVSDRLADVKSCAADCCSWLFMDDSPAGRRQWCSMSLCGNRQKARRHYRAHKRSGQAKAGAKTAH